MGKVLNTYAAYYKNEEIRLQSSSGAIFTLLAEAIISRKGVVYGVAMTDNCRAAQFIRSTDVNGLAKIRGSKYLQARVGNTYKQVKKDLKEGLWVLFSGTGCQVNGLKMFLGIEYDNLLCVDVICHGTPSPLLWRKYVEHIEGKNGSKLIDVNFRCKYDGWNDFGIKEIDEYHQEMYISKDKDSYMQMFLRDYCLRPSCYECTAKRVKFSDITIADFWGIESVAPKMDDGKGVSLVLVRTDKGKNIFEQVRGKMEVKEVSYEEGVKRNPAEYESVARPIERDTFFLDMKTLSFYDMEKKYAASLLVPWRQKIKHILKKIILQTPVCKLVERGNYTQKTVKSIVCFLFSKERQDKRI